MNIILLHGDSSEKISERLTTFVDAAKKRKWLIKHIDAKSERIMDKVSLESLFGDVYFYIVHNLNSISKADFEWLKKNNDSNQGTVVLVGKTELTKTFINKLPATTKIESFVLQKQIWKFLDEFYPKDKAQHLKALKNLLDKESPEFLSALLARRLVDLYLVSVNTSNSKLPEWRQKKLLFQAKKFESSSSIKRTIENLSEADYKAKTGLSDLNSELDRIVALELE